MFFVEVHSANTHGVTEMEKKLDWLNTFMNRDGNIELSRLPREYHWVASGKVRIPKHVPQYRHLQTLKRQKGLHGPVKHLELK